MIEPPQTITKKDLSISMVKATLWSIVFGLPLACLLMYLYLWRWGADLRVSNAKSADFLFYILIFVATLVLGSIVHELIHGFSWAYFSHKPLNTIKFGFQLKTLTPYAHCGEPMKVQAY